MTTQPSDWAVAKAWRELTASKMTSEGLEEVVGVGVAYLEKRARELDASGDEAPEASVRAFWNMLGETGDYDSAIKAAVDATPRAAEAGDRDGERYRWLRGNLLWAKSYDGYVRWTVEILMPEPGIHEGHPPVAETLDAAIDVAMGAVGAGD